MRSFTENEHQAALLRRRVKFVVEKGSMARLFKTGRHSHLQNQICKRVRPSTVAAQTSRDEYDRWLLDLIRDDCWESYSRNGIEHDRWGYFAKLFNIVIYEITCNRELFGEDGWLRIRSWWHIPFDSTVLYGLTRLDPSFPACWILKGMREEQYATMLSAARSLAAKFGIPTIWFEDAWTS